MRATLYSNGRLFTGDPERPTAEAMVVRGERIDYVGDNGTARTRAGTDALELDLAGRTVLPGFVDGHAHVLMTGEAQLKAHLTDAADVAEIQRRVAAWADTNPDAPRVLGRGWLFGAVPGGRPTRQLLDAVVPDRPVYLDANDYHSVWVNTAALAELGVTRDTPDPVGGRIVRDTDGEPTGHLEETAAIEIVWSFLAEASSDTDRDRALMAAAHAYLSSGVTSAVDMALDERNVAAMVRAERDGRLDLRVVGHWLIHPGIDHGPQIERAAELARTHRSERLRVTGVKFIVDGVIDGCTATMLKPYADGSNADPIWTADALAPAVAAADAAGLQVALHAIGDGAVRMALDALEHAAAVNGPRPRRHRIEHLEYVDPADVPRLAQLGVTASMQPVHADPAIRDNWAAMLGDERAERGFAWPEFSGAGAKLAFGTDAPTAPHPPLPNIYIATTRKSALDPELPARQPDLAIPAPDALVHGTADSAWACRAEDDVGRLRAGLLADFVVLDRDPFDHADGAAEALLRARVLRTVVGGRTVCRS
ncbi:amidohydrolase [Haloechinothrix halophila]|uniref:amidohydrolase n=1 Tax=Haloechinothrix halophila TaxID=1069073 RepID=UPI00041404A1|nr:amidohydrolase [Haloechinothrix halophila]